MSDHIPSARSAPPRDVEDVLKDVTRAIPRYTPLARNPPQDLVERVTDGMAGTEKDNDEPFQLEQTEAGREIARKNREEGREEGRKERHVDLMRAALRAVYGDITDLDELARRLVDRDHRGNLARIIIGAVLDDLRP